MQAACSLREVARETPQSDQLERTVNVIVVPDFRGKASRPSSPPVWRWLHSELPSIAPQSRVLWFEYELCLDSGLVWQHLIDMGHKLLATMVDNESRFELSSKPLLYIAHGFGGMLLKTTLIKLNTHFWDPASLRLQSAQAGVIFLGSPNPMLAQRTLWPKLTTILKYACTVPKIVLIQAELEAAVAATVSEKFRETGIDVPVLSTFETRKTKVRGFLFTIKRDFLLVDCAFAETGLPHETLIGVEADHNDICALARGTELYKEVARLVKQAEDKTVSTRESSSSRVTVTLRMDSGSGDWATEPSNISNQDSVEIQSQNQQIVAANIAALALGSTDTSSYEALPVLADFVAPERELKLPCYMVTPEMRYTKFFGRRDVLKKIDEAFAPSVDSSVSTLGCNSFAICGFGGLGKTQVVVEYALTRQNRYDAVLWVDAADETKLEESFSKIAQSLGLFNDSNADLVVSHNVVMEWLAHPRRWAASGIGGGDPSSSPPDEEATWLLIFDNADNLELLRNYWPGTRNGNIIVTSRDSAAKTSLYDSLGMSLEPFSTVEAASLLRNLVSESEDSAQTSREDESLSLATRLGGLPLAITQVSAMISKMDMTFKEFEVYYEEKLRSPQGLADLVEARPLNSQHQYTHSLFTVWAAKDLPPPASSLLFLLVLLDGTRIPESILKGSLPMTTLAYYPVTDSDYLDARSELLKLSLVKRNKAKGQLEIHGMVQDVIWARMGDTEASEALGFAVELLKHAWSFKDTFAHLVSNYEISEAILPHVLRVRAVYGRQRNWSLSDTHMTSLAQLFQWAGWYQHERGLSSLARPLLEHALQVCRQHHRQMQPILADVLFSLSSLTSVSYGDTSEALELATEHLKLREKLMDGSPETLDHFIMANGELAQAYLLSGDYGKAIEYCRISKSLDFKHPDVIAGKEFPHWANIHEAWALSALGRHEEGVILMEKILDFRKGRFGVKESPSLKLGIVKLCLGTLRARLGQKETSLQDLQEALICLTFAQGNNSLYTCQACFRLGAAHMQENQFETALTYLEQALHGFVLHDYKPEIVRTEHKIGKLLQLQGNEDLAKEKFTRAITLYKALVPPKTYGEIPSEVDFDALVLHSSR